MSIGRLTDVPTHDHASTSGTDPRPNSTGSDSSNDTVSGDEAHGTIIASRRTLERKDERLPSQPPRPRPPHVAEAKPVRRGTSRLRTKRLPLHQRDPLGEYMQAQAGTAALWVSINELNVAARSTPQDFVRMGIHTQFDARNPVHMRALSEAASGPTNNNVLASASYEL